MTIIDIMGLPGAGKSTVARALQRAMNKRSMRAFNREAAIDICVRRRDLGFARSVFKYLPRFIRNSAIGVQTALDEWHAFSVDHVPLMSLVFDVLNRKGVSDAFKEAVLYGFMQQGIQSKLYERHLGAQDTVLWDEGFVHRGFTLLGYLSPNMVKEADLDRYVDSIPCPSMVIWADCALDTVLKRLQRRVDDAIGLPLLLTSCPPEERENQLRHGLYCLGQLAMRVAHRCPLVRIPTTVGGETEAQTFVDRNLDDWIACMAVR